MTITPPETIPKLSPASFARIAKLITTELGIKMPDSKMSLVQTRLTRRVYDLGLRSLDEYAEYLFHAPEGAIEKAHFIDAVTTNKTDFFREPQHYDYLFAAILPVAARAPRGPGSRFKVWSAGCSSGVEAYTLAMPLSEHRQKAPGFDFSILATD